MNRRRFVFASTISMFVITAVVAGLTFYANYTASASVQGMPPAIRYFPVDTQAIFGMNVKAFIASPAYARLMQSHEQEFGKDLAEFTARTGVDPRRDVDYIIGAGRSMAPKGGGAILAIGSFNRDAIIGFIKSRCTPVEVEYNGAKVLMMPENNQLEKGIAFLGDTEIALGDLDSLHGVLDVRYGKTAGIAENATMRSLLTKVGSEAMFWFAGDATVLTTVPGNTPFSANLSAIQNVFGTLNVGTNIDGKFSVTAKDETAARQLADLARGLVAMGNLAASQNPDVATVARGIQVTQAQNQCDVTLTVPFDALMKLDAVRSHIGK